MAIHEKNMSPASPQIKPLCEYFGVCGGCDLQNLSYKDQLKKKSETIRRLFGGLVDVEISDVLPSPKEFFYRNRVTLHHDGNNFGFYRGQTHEIVPIKKCVIASEIVNQKIFVLNRDVLNGPRIFEVREDENSVFSQVNSFQNKNLVELVLSFCRGKKSQKILELYCGAGNLTFSLADISQKITAVDLDKSAIQVAESRRQKMKNKKINFMACDAADVAFKMSQDLQKVDMIVCDPPRAGLKSAANSICELGAERIIYVSCNPESFLRDLHIIQDRKYKLVKLAPLDMFPQTEHLELVGLFSKNPKTRRELDKAGDV